MLDSPLLPPSWPSGPRGLPQHPEGGSLPRLEAEEGPRKHGVGGKEGEQCSTGRTSKATSLMVCLASPGRTLPLTILLPFSSEASLN